MLSLTWLFKSVVLAAEPGSCGPNVLGWEVSSHCVCGRDTYLLPLSPEQTEACNLAVGKALVGRESGLEGVVSLATATEPAQGCRVDCNLPAPKNFEAGFGKYYSSSARANQFPTSLSWKAVSGAKFYLLSEYYYSPEMRKLAYEGPQVPEDALVVNGQDTFGAYSFVNGTKVEMAGNRLTDRAGKPQTSGRYSKSLIAVQACVAKNCCGEAAIVNLAELAEKDSIDCKGEPPSEAARQRRLELLRMPDAEASALGKRAHDQLVKLMDEAQKKIDEQKGDLRQLANIRAVLSQQGNHVKNVLAAEAFLQPANLMIYRVAIEAASKTKPGDDRETGYRLAKAQARHYSTNFFHISQQSCNYGNVLDLKGEAFENIELADIDRIWSEAIAAGLTLTQCYAVNVAMLAPLVLSPSWLGTLRTLVGGEELIRGLAAAKEQYDRTHELSRETLITLGNALIAVLGSPAFGKGGKVVGIAGAEANGALALADLVQFLQKDAGDLNLQKTGDLDKYTQAVCRLLGDITGVAYMVQGIGQIGQLVRKATTPRSSDETRTLNEPEPAAQTAVSPEALPTFKRLANQFRASALEQLGTLKELVAKVMKKRRLSADEAEEQLARDRIDCEGRAGIFFPRFWLMPISTATAGGGPLDCLLGIWRRRGSDDQPAQAKNLVPERVLDRARSLGSDIEARGSDLRAVEGLFDRSLETRGQLERVVREQNALAEKLIVQDRANGTNQQQKIVEARRHAAEAAKELAELREFERGVREQGLLPKKRIASLEAKRGVASAKRLPQAVELEPAPAGTRLRVLSEPVVLVHKSRTPGLKSFDADHNRNPANRDESVSSGYGVYTFPKKSLQNPSATELQRVGGDSSYEFPIKNGTTVLDLNEAWAQKELQAGTKRFKQSGLGEEEAHARAVDDLWRAHGQPQLLIGEAYQGQEVIIRDPRLLREFTESSR